MQVTQKIATGGLKPVLTVLVDVDIATSLARRDSSDRLEAENTAFFERVREGYLRLWRSEPDRVFRVDGRLSVEELAQKISAEVNRRMEGG